MVKTSKIIATLGVAAGLGIALLPLASYAATTGTNVVSVNVPGWIELTVANNAATNENVSSIDGGSQVTLSKQTNTSSNAIEHILHVTGTYKQKYTLNMYAGGTSLVGINSGVEIPSVTEGEGNAAVSLPEGATDSAWGYRFSTTGNDAHTAGTYTAATYNALPVAAAKKALRNPLTGSNYIDAKFDEYTYVNFGIKISDDQVADVYQQTINYEVEGSPANS